MHSKPIHFTPTIRWSMYFCSCLMIILLRPAIAHSLSNNRPYQQDSHLSPEANVWISGPSSTRETASPGPSQLTAEIAEQMQGDPTEGSNPSTQKIRGLSHYLKIKQRGAAAQSKPAQGSPPLSRSDRDASDSRKDAYHFEHLKSATELLKKPAEQGPPAPEYRYIFLESK